jgi:hypothetical protein
MEQKNGRSWTEYFRVITPFLLVVVTWIGGSINKNIDRLDTKVESVSTFLSQKIDCLDGKVFQHLTNDEIHTPRNIVILRQEAEALMKQRDVQFKQVDTTFSEIKDQLREIRLSLDKKK